MITVTLPEFMEWLDTLPSNFEFDLNGCVARAGCLCPMMAYAQAKGLNPVRAGTTHVQLGDDSDMVTVGWGYPWLCKAMGGQRQFIAAELRAKLRNLNAKEQ